MAATVTSNAASMNWSAKTWTITGLTGDMSGVDGDLNSGVLDCSGDTPGWGAGNELAGRWVQLDGGTWYLIVSNTDDTLTIADPPGDGDPLAWLIGGPPLAGDAQVVATGHTVADDVTRIPVTSGLLVSLDGVGTGQMTVAMSTNRELHVAGAITCGTKAGFITTSGSGAGVTFDIHSDSVVGGTGTGAYAIFPTHTVATLRLHTHTLAGNTGTSSQGLVGGYGPTTVDGAVEGTPGACTIQGGSGASAFGIGMYNGGGAGPTLNGTAEYPITVTGGSGSQAQGIGAAANNITTVPTYNHVRHVDSANCNAYAGKPPIWNITDKANYIQMPTVNADERGSQVMRFYLPPAQGEIIEGKSAVGEDLVDPPGYGVPTYHEATVAEVEDGVMFGPSSAYEGEYAGGGGGGVRRGGALRGA